jgi:hypothetical protein
MGSGKTGRAPAAGWQPRGRTEATGQRPAPRLSRALVLLLTLLLAGVAAQTASTAYADGGNGVSIPSQPAQPLLPSGCLSAKIEAAWREHPLLGKVTDSGCEKTAPVSPQGTTGTVAGFEHGQVYSSSRGTFVTAGPAGGLYGDMDRWGAEGDGSGSWLGYPTRGTAPAAGSTRSEFEGGFISVDGAEAFAHPYQWQAHLAFVDGDAHWSDQDRAKVEQTMEALPQALRETQVLRGFKRTKERRNGLNPAWFSDGYVYLSDAAFAADAAVLQHLDDASHSPSGIVDLEFSMYTLEYIVAHEVSHALLSTQNKTLTTTQHNMTLMSNDFYMSGFARASGYTYKSGAWECSKDVAASCASTTTYALTYASTDWFNRLNEDFAESAAMYRYQPERLGRDSGRYLFLKVNVFDNVEY